MNYAYTIVYVSDVPAALDFYNRAFGFPVRFLHESNGYGELETGGTALAFAAHEVAGGSLPDGYEPLSEMPRPAGIEIGFTTSAVELAMESAVRNGATLVAAPKVKPWGQTVAYVRCPSGYSSSFARRWGENLGFARTTPNNPSSPFQRQ